MNVQPLLGAARLAIGRGDGMVRFGDSPQAFLASLAPLVAFPLVGALVLVFSGSPGLALAALLLTLVAQLSPPVVSHWLAVRWGREDDWLRFATAFNWCQWAIPVAAVTMLVALQTIAGNSMSVETAGQVLVLGLAAYGLWLHWTVARHGLDLSRGRAALLVLIVNAVTIALVIVPRMVAQALQ